MKAIILIFICSAILLSPLASSPKDNVKTNGKNPRTAKRTVLIIGLKEENITSNYFMAENIAERTSLAKDSIGSAFSRMLSESIVNSGNPRFEFICCLSNKNNNEILSKVQYKFDKDMLVSDLSGLKDSDYQDFLNSYNADYVIFLDHYFLKYLNGNSLFHILNYDVYNRDKKNIIVGKTYFNSAELLPLVNYEKNYKKAGAKIVQQLDKVAE
jgi:hypothetical protein